MCTLTMQDYTPPKEEPRTVEEWMQQINAQFDAIDAMVADSKTVLRKWHEQRAHEGEQA